MYVKFGLLKVFLKVDKMQKKTKPLKVEPVQSNGKLNMGYLSMLTKRAVTCRISDIETLISKKKVSLHLEIKCHKPEVKRLTLT